MSSAKPSTAYWFFTGLLTAIMGCAGILLLFRVGGALTVIHDHLGYPVYVATLLGVAKLAGLAAILLPVPARWREWAYAGFTFDVLAACFSILWSPLPARAVVDPLLALVAVLGSYVCWRRRSASA